MSQADDCLGQKLAPFNPSGDNVIRAAIDMLQVKYNELGHISWL